MQEVKMSLKQVSATAMQVTDPPTDIRIDRPAKMGGSNQGLMGGQHLLAGVGGCFCSNVFAAAIARDIKLEGLAVDVLATISNEGPKRFSKITLTTSVDSCSDPEGFDHLLKIAEKACISINTMKANLEVKVTVHDGPASVRS